MDWLEVVDRCGRIAAIDLLRVWRGTSSACRIRISRSALPRVTALAETLALGLAVGRDTVTPASSYGWQSPGPLRSVVTAHESDATSLVYLGRNIRSAERLRRYDEAGLASHYAAAAGVPPCCALGFNPDTPADMLLRRYPDEHLIGWVLNAAMRPLDCALLSYVPCSPECTPSRQIAYDGFELLRVAHPSLAAQLSVVLCAAVLSAGVLGTAAFHIHSTCVVGEVFAAEGALLRLVRPGISIVRLDEGLMVDGTLLPADTTRLYRHG